LPQGYVLTIHNSCFIQFPPQRPYLQITQLHSHRREFINFPHKIFVGGTEL